MLMARLLQEFHLTLLPGQNEIKHEERLTLRPKGGALYTITRRKKSKDRDLKNNSRITDRTRSTDWVRYVKGELRGKNEVILDDWPLYHVSIFDNIIC